MKLPLVWKAMCVSLIGGNEYLSISSWISEYVDGLLGSYAGFFYVLLSTTFKVLRILPYENITYFVYFLSVMWKYSKKMSNKEEIIS